MVGTTRARQGRWLRRGALVLLGGLLGVLGARYLLVGSGWSLLPWGLVAVLVGMSADSRPQAAVDAGLYGFVLSLVFMVAGYAGEAPLVGRLPFFALLGLFGAVCAALLALAGWLVRTRLRRGPGPGAPT